MRYAKRQKSIPTMIGVNELIKVEPIRPQCLPVILMVQRQQWALGQVAPVRPESRSYIPPCLWERTFFLFFPLDINKATTRPIATGSHL